MVQNDVEVALPLTMEEAHSELSRVAMRCATQEAGAPVHRMRDTPFECAIATAPDTVASRMTIPSPRPSFEGDSCVQARPVAWRPEPVQTSDRKRQSALHPHGHRGEHTARRVRGGGVAGECAGVGSKMMSKP